MTSNTIIHYEVDVKDVPEVLKRDWGLILDEDESKTAIRLFVWKFGEQEERDESDFLEWNLKSGESFTGGYAHGRISFSLNLDGYTILAALIKVVTAIAKHESKDDVSAIISVTELFQSVVKIKLLKNYERCIFLQIIQLTSNDKSISFKKDEIENIFCSGIFKNNFCPYHDVFPCDCYHEDACMRNRLNFDDAFDALVEKNVIRPETANKELYHII